MFKLFYKGSYNNCCEKHGCWLFSGNDLFLDSFPGIGECYLRVIDIDPLISQAFFIDTIKIKPLYEWA